MHPLDRYKLLDRATELDGMGLRCTWACLKDDRGQGLVEYALVIAIVAIVALATLRVLGRRATNALSSASNGFS